MELQERFLNALKPVVAPKGFSEKTLQGLVTNLSASLTDESTDEDIQGVIEANKWAFDLMQSENTRYANEVKKKFQAQQPDKEKEDKQPEEKGDPTNEKLRSLEEKLEKLLENQEKQTIAQKWGKLCESKGINNEILVRKWQPQTEEEFESAIEELSSIHEKMIIDESNGKSLGKPNSGGSSAGANPKGLTAVGKQVLESFKKTTERKNQTV